MENIGERLVGDYLKAIKNCDFVEYNLHTKNVQGEIDVIGINANKKELYVCEVAVHLETGLQYVNPSTKTPDNVNRFLKKFEKNKQYAENNFEGYQIAYMIWSPIVKTSKSGSKNNQANDILEIIKQLKEKLDIDVKIICNNDYKSCIDELRDWSKNQTQELKSPVMRLFQIEEKLKRHLEKINQK